MDTHPEPAVPFGEVLVVIANKHARRGAMLAHEVDYTHIPACSIRCIGEQVLPKRPEWRTSIHRQCGSDITGPADDDHVEVEAPSLLITASLMSEGPILLQFSIYASCQGVEVFLEQHALAGC